ncbi:MAG: FUSC family protein [Chitinophagaceae bacterium]|nr:FUSC family protein [Chitinophagaceae bacterium]
MNYINEFKKFITGQYLTKGLRITVGAILPAWILYKFDLLATGIALPLGALMVSLTDSPGPIHHRRNGMLVSNVLNFIVALAIGFTRYYPWLLVVELTLFSFFLSIIGIYGNRAGSVGLIAIIVMVLNIDVHHAQERVLHDALFMLAGGAWYMLLSLTLYSLRPYRLIQQALGECIISTASYLKTKARLYKTPTKYDEVYEELLPLQIEIHNQHEQLRELLFKARGFTRESTTKGRILLMMFLDSVDLFEQVMTSQQNYKSLHDYFDGSDILEKFRVLIIETANELDKIGLVVQSGFPSKDTGDLDEMIRETDEVFTAYHKANIKPENIEGFISLRHILNSIKDIYERIKRLHRYSTYSSEVSREVKQEVDVDKFVSRQEIDFKLLAENLSLQSNVFRHSLRVSLCILTGYIIAQFFPFGHSYWILLTIVTILKPAYSISKKRNAERLLGTLAGVGTGFILLYLVHNDALIFALMILSMIVGYSFLQIQYMVAVAGITLYVLFSFHFLHPVDFRSLAADRVIDTAIGSALAFVASLFFLPRWEHEQVDEYIQKLMDANRKYFTAVAKAFYGKPADIMEYKMTRKEAYVALANLSDGFQRLLSEPKKNNNYQQLLHQLVVSNHMLTSHIATLAVYAKSLAPKYQLEAFKPVAENIERQMQSAIQLASGQNTSLPANTDKEFSGMRYKIQELLSRRISELKEGAQQSDVKKSLSAYKTITDQFEIINTITADQINTLRKMST